MNKRLAVFALMIAAAMALPGAAVARDAAGGAARPAGLLAEEAHGGAHETGDAKDPNLFAGDIGNIVFTLLIFLILLAVLGKTAWGPLVKALQQREATIRESLEKARSERLQAEELLKQYQAQIEKARVEATAIVDEGRRDAEATRRRLQEEARKDADETLARAKREIGLARDAAIAELYEKTADLAVQVAGGIINKSLSADDHRQLVRESVERMNAAPAAGRN